MRTHSFQTLPDICSANLRNTGAQISHDTSASCPSVFCREFWNITNELVQISWAVPGVRCCLARIARIQAWSVRSYWSIINHCEPRVRVGGKGPGSWELHICPFLSSPVPFTRGNEEPFCFQCFPTSCDWFVLYGYTVRTKMSHCW